MALRPMHEAQIDLRHTNEEKKESVDKELFLNKEEDVYHAKKNINGAIKAVDKTLKKALPRAPLGRYKFPDDFLWGTSTSAYQTEGGNINDWSRWEKTGKRILAMQKQGKTPSDYICNKACKSYELYKKDIDLAASLNTNSIRLGLEWSRLEPKKDAWNTEALNHYRDVLVEAKKHNLKIIITLWHWTSPTWVADEGGWVNKKVIEYYARYVEFIIQELGGAVDYWVTLNEPNIYIINSYLRGKFPPQKHNIFKAKKVFNNLLQAHKKAYKLIHKHFPQAQVSFTNLTNFFEPARKWCPVETGLAKLFDYFFNKRFLNSCRDYLDYIGLDYYFHDRIVWYPPFRKNINARTSDLGWEIYPEGLYYVLHDLAKFKKPIIILENGLADKDDNLRESFIKEHLYYAHKALQKGIEIKGYFHWSLLDNFEWAEGFGPKFGLYKFDKTSFERTPRPSAEIYAQICKNNILHI